MQRAGMARFNEIVPHVLNRDPPAVSLRGKCREKQARVLTRESVSLWTLSSPLGCVICPNRKWD